MTALIETHDLGIDLALPGGLISALLPGPAPKLNILRGVSLSIAAGESFGLVGESGSGKTTLARALLGLIAPSAGRLEFRGQPLDSAAARARLRRDAAMMFQDPIGSLSPRMRIRDLVAEPMQIHGLTRSAARARAAALLDRVGLPAAIAARYPHELSGGQARRVCTARALALSPALVVADEPTAGLDVSIQGEILNLMADLREAEAISFLVISHNLAVIRHTASRIAVLYLGTLVETGPTAEIFARPLHPYTASLIASEPDPDPRRRRADLAIRGEIPGLLRRPKGCAFHTRCPLAEARCRSEAPALRPISPGRSVRCHFAGP